MAGCACNQKRIDMNNPAVVHHMAALDDSPFPPNSLEAIRASLDAGAEWIEIDVTPLAADDYLLVHDPVLESETSGAGEVIATHPGAVGSLKIKHRGEITDYRPPLLSEVVALFASHSGRARLQIDYKHVYPMRDDEPLRRLIGLIEPLGERVLVSTGADWHLRRLHKLADWLDLGFDIGFYLDYRPQPVDPRLPPHRLGDYGYHDDHPLASRRALPTGDYLSLRCDAMLASAPFVSVWYVHYLLLARCLDDGFNMAEWLHRAGIHLDAWTLDVGKPAADHVVRLRDSGVDQFTTNTPRALAGLLNGVSRS
jgi:glycerophosphoryl diester phosphodiesterase